MSYQLSLVGFGLFANRLTASEQSGVPGMTIPSQEGYDREYQWSTFAGGLECPSVLKMDVWVRREPEIAIAPRLNYAITPCATLSLSCEPSPLQGSLRCQDRRSICGTREGRNRAAFEHKEGNSGPRNV